MKRICGIFLLLCSFICTYAESVVTVYPKYGGNNQLATKINCHIGESRHFKYNAVTNFWGNIKGQVFVNADLVLHCLGDDKDGKHGEEALKYLAEVSNLVLQEKHDSIDTLQRRKRGIGDFFSNAWQKIKNFFGRMFGSSTQKEERDNSAESSDDPTYQLDERKTTTDLEEESEEESDEPLNYNSLFSKPFQFVQLANGSIPEISFAEDDQDGRVRNFKRHLVDAFATQFSLNPAHGVVVENSVMGEHLSNYNITIEEIVTTPSLALSSLISNPDYWAEDSGEKVVIQKLITEEDILTLAPEVGNSAVNDKDKMALNSHQRQVFSGGKIVSVSGSSSLMFFHDGYNRRQSRKRRESSDEEDVMSYFQVHSQYEMQFHKRMQRSTSSTHHHQFYRQNYLPSSRTAEMEDNSVREKLRNLQKSIGNTTVLVNSLLNNLEKNENGKLQLMFEMIDQEVLLRLDEGPQSLAADVRRILNEDNMEQVCSSNFKRCKDLLQLLALAGGSNAEEVLLYFLLDNDAFDVIQKQQIADILSDLSNPSKEVFTTLATLIRGKMLKQEVLGTAALSLSNLASKAKDVNQQSIGAVLLQLLEDNLPSEQCEADTFTLDILEAIGNLKAQNTIDSVLETSSKCSDRVDVQIASIHAVRHLTSSPKVQMWLENMIKSSPSCDVQQALVESLVETVYEQALTRDIDSWPRLSFNSVDATLRNKLLSLDGDSHCATESTIRYFRLKKEDEAKDALQQFYKSHPEYQRSYTKHRSKRAAWDDLNCNEWTEDNKYRPIQDKEEFAVDKVTYNKRKSCLAFRKFGAAGANAEIYAGMFAGIKQPSDPPKYKLFTKFVSGLNFLGHETEVGSFYFYHQGGHTKAYVRIMGKTRQEISHDGCTPTELIYRPITHIPLYFMTFGAVQFSFGIHLSSQLSLDTHCPLESVYELMPLTNVRLGAEAVANVLFLKASVNLGANFNYHLKFTFDPVPNMCLSGKHGYDPMSISIEAFYQTWKVTKLKYSEPKTWKPKFLNWEVSKGAEKQWFDDTCVLKDSPSLQSTEPPVVSSTWTIPADDNDIIIVRA